MAVAVMSEGGRFQLNPICEGLDDVKLWDKTCQDITNRLCSIKRFTNGHEGGDNTLRLWLSAITSLSLTHLEEVLSKLKGMGVDNMYLLEDVTAQDLEREGLVEGLAHFVVRAARAHRVYHRHLAEINSSSSPMPPSLPSSTPIPMIPDPLSLGATCTTTNQPGKRRRLRSSTEAIACGPSPSRSKRHGPALGGPNNCHHSDKTMEVCDDEIPLATTAHPPNKKRKMDSGGMLVATVKDSISKKCPLAAFKALMCVVDYLKKDPKQGACGLMEECHGLEAVAKALNFLCGNVKAAGCDKEGVGQMAAPVLHALVLMLSSGIEKRIDASSLYKAVTLTMDTFPDNDEVHINSLLLASHLATSPGYALSLIFEYRLGSIIARVLSDERLNKNHDILKNAFIATSTLAEHGGLLSFGEHEGQVYKMDLRRVLGDSQPTNEWRGQCTNLCAVLASTIKAIPPCETSLLYEGVYAVCKLSLDEDNTTDLGKAGVCKTIVDILKVFVASDVRECWTEACRAVWNLATNNEYNQEALYESNACEYVVQVLRKCGDDQRVLLPAWGAVWALCINCYNFKHAFGRAGICGLACKQLEKVLREDVDGEVKEMVVSAIGSLAEDHVANRMELGNARTCQKVLQILNEQPWPRMAGAALYALYGLTGGKASENVVRLRELRHAVPACRKILHTYLGGGSMQQVDDYDKSQIARHCLNTISNLVGDHDSEMIKSCFKNPDVSIVGDILASYPQVLDVQVAGLRVLAMMWQFLDNTNLPLSLSDAVLDSIASMFSSLHQGQTVDQELLRAIVPSTVRIVEHTGNYHFHAAICNRLARSLVQTIRKLEPWSDSRLRVLCFQLVERLAYQHYGAIKLLDQLGMTSEINNAILESDDGIALQALRAATNMFWSPGDITAEGREAILMSVTKRLGDPKFSKDPDIMGRLCALIFQFSATKAKNGNMAKATVEMTRLVYEYEGPTLLIQAIPLATTFPTHEALIEAVAAIGNLAIDTHSRQYLGDLQACHAVMGALRLGRLHCWIEPGQRLLEWSLYAIAQLAADHETNRTAMHDACGDIAAVLEVVPMGQSGDMRAFDENRWTAVLNLSEGNPPNLAQFGRKVVCQMAVMALRQHQSSNNVGMVDILVEVISLFCDSEMYGQQLRENGVVKAVKAVKKNGTMSGCHKFCDVVLDKLNLKDRARYWTYKH